MSLAVAVGADRPDRHLSGEFGKELLFRVPRDRTGEFIESVSKQGVPVRYDRETRLWSAAAVGVDRDDPVIREFLVPEKPAGLSPRERASVLSDPANAVSRFVPQEYVNELVKKSASDVRGAVRGAVAVGVLVVHGRMDDEARSRFAIEAVMSGERERDMVRNISEGKISREAGVRLALTESVVAVAGKLESHDERIDRAVEASGIRLASRARGYLNVVGQDVAVAPDSVGSRDNGREVSEDELKTVARIRAAEASGERFVARYVAGGFALADAGSSAGKEQMAELMRASVKELKEIASVSSSAYAGLVADGREGTRQGVALKSGYEAIKGEIDLRERVSGRGQAQGVQAGIQERPSVTGSVVERYGRRGFMLAGEGRPRREAQVHEVSQSSTMEIRDLAVRTREVYRQLYTAELSSRFSSVFADEGRGRGFIAKANEVLGNDGEGRERGSQLAAVMFDRNGQQDVRQEARRELIAIFGGLDFEDQKRFSAPSAEDVQRTNEMNALKRGFQLLDREYQQRTGKPLGRLVSEQAKQVDRSILGAGSSAGDRETAAAANVRETGGEGAASVVQRAILRRRSAASSMDL